MLQSQIFIALFLQNTKINAVQKNNTISMTTVELVEVRKRAVSINKKNTYFNFLPSFLLSFIQQNNAGKVVNKYLLADAGSLPKHEKPLSNIIFVLAKFKIGANVEYTIENPGTRKYTNCCTTPTIKANTEERIINLNTLF